MPGRTAFGALRARAALVARCVLLRRRRRRCLAALAITSFVAATTTTALKASAAFVPVAGGALGIPLGVAIGIAISISIGSLTVGPAFRALAMCALGRCRTFGGIEQVGRSLGSRRLSARYFGARYFGVGRCVGARSDFGVACCLLLSLRFLAAWKTGRSWFAGLPWFPGRRGGPGRCWLR